MNFHDGPMQIPHLPYLFPNNAVVRSPFDKGRIHLSLFHILTHFSVESTVWSRDGDLHILRYVDPLGSHNEDK